MLKIIAKTLVLLTCCFAVSSSSLNAAEPGTAASADLTAYQNRVQKILNSFVSGIGKDPSLYTIIVEKSDVINAYATVGRKIVVYTGLIDSLKNESALAFVVAHELGHIEERHSINGMVRSGFFTIVKSVFIKETNTIGSNIYDGVTYMGGLHYSRGAEKEADVFAVGLMNRLYCKAPGKLEFFETAMKTQKASKIGEYLSTHPLSSTRLEYLKKDIMDAGCKV